MTVSTYVSIITLNVNWPNAPIKRQTKGDKMDRKARPSTCCLQETSDQKTHKYSKWKDRKNIPCKRKWQKKSVAIIVSDKIDYKRLLQETKKGIT